MFASGSCRDASEHLHALALPHYVDGPCSFSVQRGGGTLESTADPTKAHNIPIRSTS